MRKTLTVLTLIATTISLAACKMPWDSEPKAAAVTPPPTEAVDTAQSTTELPAPAQTTAPAMAAATPNSKPAVK